MNILNRFGLAIFLAMIVITQVDLLIGKEIYSDWTRGIFSIGIISGVVLFILPRNKND